MRIDIDHLTLPEPEAVALLKSEVRRLESVIAASQPTLTDAEREAISRDLSWLQWCEDNNQIGDVGKRDIATLRSLLERL